MRLDPTNYRTWSAFEDHPIFGPSKSSIKTWSHDPSRYCNLEAYGRFWPEHYVHIDPAPPLEYQERIAQRDIANLADACQQIESRFGDIRYELVILDDLTAYVWLSHERFLIEVFPGLPKEGPILKMFVDVPDIDEAEQDCPSVPILVETLSQLFGTEQTDEREPE
jgi:hypothetical protein